MSQLPGHGNASTVSGDGLPKTCLPKAYPLWDPAGTPNSDEQGIFVWPLWQQGMGPFLSGQGTRAGICGPDDRLDRADIEKEPLSLNLRA